MKTTSVICDIYGSGAERDAHVQSIRVLVIPAGAHLTYPNGELMVEPPPLVDITRDYSGRARTRLKGFIGRGTHKPGWKPEDDAKPQPAAEPAPKRTVAE